MAADPSEIQKTSARLLRRDAARDGQRLLLSVRGSTLFVPNFAIGGGIWTTLLMVTESPGLIGAARRWSSDVSRQSASSLRRFSLGRFTSYWSRQRCILYW